MIEQNVYAISNIQQQRSSNNKTQQFHRLKVTDKQTIISLSVSRLLDFFAAARLYLLRPK
jgi:predicted sulfurtransferase